MKDNFSEQSGDYARFRPTYPSALYDFLYKNTPAFNRAWDCGTGNGQIAAVLAERFRKVEATDISASQLEQAIPMPNITYTLQAAEQTTFPDHHFDLITVAQAVHWFDFDPFYAEVGRCLRPGGLIALIGYQLFRIDKTIDQVIDHYYKNIIGPCWDPERRHIDAAYRSIPFPFQELPAPKIRMQYEWSFDQLTGYLSTWSAAQHFINKNEKDPVRMIRSELRTAWGNSEVRKIRFPLILRVGVVRQ